MVKKRKKRQARWDEKPPGVVNEAFTPTDPRNVSAIGGVRLGEEFRFVADDQMPRLEIDHVITACDNIVRGTECYPSLLYLSRARAEDARTLFDATQSSDIRQRWERLWVLSPFFARLARSPEGQKELLDCIRDDLAAVHLLSKFIEQKNDSVKRLFKRTHDDLLKLLLEHLVENYDDSRRLNLLTSIIAMVETDGDVLRKILESFADKQVIDETLASLSIKGRHSTRLSSNVLRRKLQNLGEP
jgi:hypothetical protein